ncbi:hypothetical protein [Bradyrhizobium sp. CIR3A]|uniref:hypothetical protein n=1 Tax=Bradyrhizobium sp. CIR3A TaxID=2663838 RepID=UPI001606CAE4|nr:hypothetical protein [Bradyrhizobium sp. CIR3A]MBB4259480.1 hypothetical protein [Bradyrhizobium sp. CIR3A]
MATYIRSAVHVPVHSAPRQVPEPEVPLSRPKPTARLMPVLKVTLMLPASATRPDAVTAALVDAICPLLIPIATVAPLPQVSLEDEIRTFQAPSKLVDAAFACPQSSGPDRGKDTLAKTSHDTPHWLNLRGIVSRHGAD